MEVIFSSMAARGESGLSLLVSGIRSSAAYARLPMLPGGMAPPAHADADLCRPACCSRSGCVMAAGAEWSSWDATLIQMVHADKVRAPSTWTCRVVSRRAPRSRLASVL